MDENIQVGDLVKSRHRKPTKRRGKKSTQWYWLGIICGVWRSVEEFDSRSSIDQSGEFFEILIFGTHSKTTESISLIVVEDSDFQFVSRV